MMYSKLLKSLPKLSSLEENKLTKLKAPIEDMENTKKELEEIRKQSTETELRYLKSLSNTLSFGTLSLSNEINKVGPSASFMLKEVHDSVQVLEQRLEKMGLIEKPSESSESSIYSILASLKHTNDSLQKKELSPHEIAESPSSHSTSPMGRNVDTETLSFLLIDWQRLCAEQNTFLRDITNNMSSSVPQDVLSQLRQFFFRSELLSDKLSNLCSES